MGANVLLISGCALALILELCLYSLVFHVGVNVLLIVHMAYGLVFR